MKNLLTSDTPDIKKVTAAYQFRPWPFADHDVLLDSSVLYINHVGGERKSADGWYLVFEGEDVLVEWDDGTMAVTSAAGLAAYRALHGEEFQ